MHWKGVGLPPANKMCGALEKCAKKSLPKRYIKRKFVIQRELEKGALNILEKRGLSYVACKDCHSP